MRKTKLNREVAFWKRNQLRWDCLRLNPEYRAWYDKRQKAGHGAAMDRDEEERFGIYIPLPYQKADFKKAHLYVTSKSKLKFLGRFLDFTRYGWNSDKPTLDSAVSGVRWMHFNEPKKQKEAFLHSISKGEGVKISFNISCVREEVDAMVDEAFELFEKARKRTRAFGAHSKKTSLGHLKDALKIYEEHIYGRKTLWKIARERQSSSEIQLGAYQRIKKQYQLAKRSVEGAVKIVKPRNLGRVISVEPSEIRFKTDHP